MKKAIYLLVILGILGEGYYAWTHREGNKSNLKYYFGMVPEAYLPKEFNNDNVQTLSYWVKMDFPANTAVNYYEESLKTKGWSPFEMKDQGSQRKWVYGLRVDPSTNGSACAYMYQAAWINPSRDRMTQLNLVYYDPTSVKVCPPSPKNNELVVTLQEIPYKP